MSERIEVTLADYRDLIRIAERMNILMRYLESNQYVDKKEMKTILGMEDAE